MTAVSEIETMTHMPLLRWGQPYRSLDVQVVRDCRTGQELAAMSVANAGLVRRDLRGAAAGRAALRAMGAAARLAASERAAALYMTGDLPAGDGDSLQGAADYVRQLAATSGLPHALVRANMEKLRHVLVNMPTILAGLTRGLDPAILDRGHGEQAGLAVAFAPTTEVLGAVLPSNSPGVNSLWLPALALGIPVALKPGREEPWTPWRLIQALIAAGLPAAAFGFYPTDHEGADAIVRGCGRALVFGDRSVAERYAGNPAVEVHGPGHSKVVIGADCVDHWQDYLDVLVESVAGNGGRSCVNASAILLPRHADALAAALAERLATLQPRAVDDPAAGLAAFANPAVAEAIDRSLTVGLETPGARCLSPSPRRVERDGVSYLLPTVVRCGAGHPLADREFLFPYCSVVECSEDDLVASLGHSLAVTLISRDPALIAAVVAAPQVHRVNIGPVATSRVAWDQPHEGNLFDFLYTRRAVQAGW